jgi:hypothetical protein
LGLWSSNFDFGSHNPEINSVSAVHSLFQARSSAINADRDRAGPERPPWIDIAWIDIVRIDIVRIDIVRIDIVRIGVLRFQ